MTGSQYEDDMTCKRCNDERPPGAQLCPRCEDLRASRMAPTGTTRFVIKSPTYGETVR